MLNSDPLLRDGVLAGAVEKHNTLRILRHAAEGVVNNIWVVFLIFFEFLLDVLHRFLSELSVILHNVHVVVAGDDVSGMKGS